MARFASSAALLFALISGIAAEKLKIAPDQRYLALMTVKTSTLQEELDQAAASGFEVVFASDQGVLLKRAGSREPARYHLIAVQRIATLEKELNAAAQKGFMAMPGTVTKSGDEVLVLGVRAPGSSARYSYRVLKSDDLVESRLRELASKGFSPIGVFLQQSTFGRLMESSTTGSLHIVLHGPADGSTVVPARRARILSTTKTSTMEKELNQTAAQGFRVSGASLMKVMLEENEDAASKLEYRLLGATRYDTLKKEIIESGRDGYRVLPHAIMHYEHENIVIMERPVGHTRPYEYDLIETDPKKRDTLDQTMRPLEEKGFVPVGLFLHHKYIIIMEKGPGPTA